MKRARLLLAAGVVVAGFVYLVVGGIRGAIVYYITPTELHAQGQRAVGRTIRLGGQVRPGSKVWDPQTQQLRFVLSDDSTNVPVYYRGAPPSLFTEGQGAVVEGKWEPGGVFLAHSIIVKHSEVYGPPSPRP